jgi:hypothetical protein
MSVIKYNSHTIQHKKNLNMWEQQQHAKNGINHEIMREIILKRPVINGLKIHYHIIYYTLKLKPSHYMPWR